MNYGFWLLAGQTAQTAVMLKQAQQMGAVANELQLQRMMQERQAWLAHLLFETERVVQYLGMVAQRDRLAAGVLSTLRLRDVNGVHVELFHDIESKRAWSHAIGTMQSMWRALEEDHTLRDRGRALVHAIDQLQGWRAFVTSDPRARLTEFEQAADRARADATRAKRNLIICVALIPGSFLFLVIGALFEVITGYEASFVAVLATFMFLAGIFGTVALLAGRGSTKRKVEEREREALEFRTQLDRFNGFLADPYGGRLLEQAAEQHPAFLDQSNGAFSRG